MPVPSSEVFSLLHDYSRRLEWDTLLSRASLCDGWTTVERNAETICTGRWYLGGITLKTSYISFEGPRCTAVKMLNRPLLFETFAASIRHDELPNGKSTVQYQYNFTARPTWLRWLLHPLMNMALRWETRKRLQALGRALGSMKADRQKQDVGSSSVVRCPQANSLELIH